MKLSSGNRICDLNGAHFVRRVWRNHLFLFLILAAVLLASSCASVPLTGRSQLSLIPESSLMQMSVDSYKQVLGQSKMSRNRRQTAMVKRVGRRVAKASEEFLRANGLGEEIKNYKWEFNLLEADDTVNAFCMPGGKIAVYSGILPYTKTEAGLAVVIGHEVAHALAKHGSERMSQALLAEIGGVALSAALSTQARQTQQAFMAAFGMGVQVGVILPYSRKHEYEADRIGLTLMAMGGYDPHAAAPFWGRMNKASGGSRPPEFLSTHPAPDSRIKEIKNYMPEAMKYYKK